MNADTTSKSLFVCDIYPDTGCITYVKHLSPGVISIFFKLNLLLIFAGLKHYIVLPIAQVFKHLFYGHPTVIKAADSKNRGITIKVI